LAKIFSDNPEEYRKEIKSCLEDRECISSVKISINKLKNSMECRKDLLDKFSQQVKSELPVVEKVQEMKKWFLENYLEKIKDI
jgi:hypothetical protein